MRRIIAGVLVGIMVGATAQGAGREEPVTDLPMQTLDKQPFLVPASYGRLVAVTVDSEVQYLYFQDEAGAVRIVLVGPRGAASRARAAMELLSQSAHLIKRRPSAAQP
jgi:hypothetical protein